MNKNTLYLLFSFLLFGSTICFAQTQSVVSKNNVIPPSPTASALGKYADWPVSLYSGIPQIDIPLYTLVSKSVSLPISMSYHASGIKVDEYASWVGLGWSLNAGGVITRTVRGLPDDQPTSGYFDSRTLLRDPGRGYDNAANFSVYHQQALGALDSQPDVYMFNAMGRSFKFFIDSNYNIQSIPKNAIKISLPPYQIGAFQGNEQWTAELEDGTKLYFGGLGATERTENSSNYVNDDFYTNVGFASSWYLKKIVPSTGPETTFQYVGEEYITGNTLSYTDYLRVDRAIFRAPETNSSQSRIHGVRLSGIQNENQLIKFIPQAGSRSDLSYTYALDSIKVYETGAQKVIKQFKMNYDYTQSLRLRLKSITEVASDNTISYQPWMFIYSEISLPERGAFSQDHWGYFNGATGNRTLLPYAEGFPANTVAGDREAHFPYSTADMVTQINYPTGGYSKFNFDAHSYTDVTTDGPREYVRVTLETTDPMGTEKAANFTATSFRDVKLNYSFTRDPNENDPLYIVITITNNNNNVTISRAASVNGSYSETLALSPGNYTLKVRNPDMTNSYCFVDLSYNTDVSPYSVNRVIGGARIKDIVYFDGKNEVNKKSYLYENPYCPAPIKNRDYIYRTNIYVQNPCIPQTGGEEQNIRDIYPYDARTSYSKAVVGSTGGGNVGYGKVSVLNGENGINGSEINTFSNEVADSITYSFPFPPVTSFDYKRGLLLNQKIKDAAGNLKKNLTNTYLFVLNYRQKGYNAAFTLYNPCYDANSYFNTSFRSIMVNGPFSTSSEWVQKISETEDIYDNAGNIVSTITNYYYDNPAHMQVTRTVSIKSDGKIITNVSTFPNDYASGTTFLDQMRANHQIALPIEQVSYQEDASGVKILKGSVTRYKEGGKGLVDKVYELESINPVTLSAFKFSNKPIGTLPTSVGFSAYAPDSRYAEKLTYNEYDNLGNPLQITVKDGLSKSYKWGYNKQYPIAEVLNAAPTEFFYEGFEETAGAVTGAAHSGNKYSTTTIVSWTKPNSRTYVISYWYRSGSIWVLRPEQAYTGNSFTLTGGDAYDDINIFPSDSQLASYTYIPFIGMGSATDAKGKSEYYDYDAFQRLKNIRDQNKNIIKNYSYHYQSEIARTKYLNIAMSRVATRTNCPEGYIGQSRVYTLPAGTYTSYISQEAANQLAVDDLNANTQANANLYGDCLSACSGPDKKMINGNCETGRRVNTGSAYLSNNNYRCTYHYEWSDGSSSVDYTENNSAPCAFD